MKKVFFSCSMRAGFDFIKQSDLQKIPEIIESLGGILVSKHQSVNNAIEKENELNPKNILDRNLKLLSECDLFIAEISNPSLGVGIEIEMARNLNKPVLCLYNSQIDEKKISALIRGMVSEKFKVLEYGNVEELENITENFYFYF